MTDFRGHSVSDTHSNCASEGGGRSRWDTQCRSAPAPHSGGHPSRDIHGSCAAEAEGQPTCATRSMSALGDHSSGHRIGATHSTSAAQDGGLSRPVLQIDSAPVTNSGDPLHVDSQGGVVAPGDQEGQFATGNHQASAGLIATIREVYRLRVDLHRAEKSLTLQIRGRCRRMVGGDKTVADKLYGAMLGKGEHEYAHAALAANAPFLEARGIVEARRKAAEKELTKLAKQLPVADWMDGVKGLAALSLGAVIGEAGDLSQYDNPAKLWKRFGLAVMGDGSRQRRVSGVAALDHGYSPERRSIVWNIGECVIKAQVRNVKDADGKRTDESVAIGPYGQLFLDRREYERERVETKGHAKNRASRYVQKRLLRDLWRAWRAASGSTVPNDVLPPSDIPMAAE